ncbi:MAG TPA: hypothetical protein VIE87_04945 [Pseudolabrys sp.]|jgi:hypothetical protein
MPEYRFYRINDKGHIAGPAEGNEFPNDEAATKQAKQLLNGHDIEIWQGTRIVAYLVPDQD